MNHHPADAVLDAIDRLAAPACVGIDPVLDRLPEVLRPGASSAASAARAIGAFSVELLDAVAGRVPCVKFQSACFERYGHAGIAALEGCIRAARQRELKVILDAKRGDIGISAEQYAAAVFGDDPEADAAVRPDWVTINAYLGADGIRPFLKPGRGAFALVRTSNPGGDAVQAQRLADGRTVAESVAELVASIGEALVGERGYSSLGAVVAATRAEDAGRLRRIMPNQLFLVPGFGAQGGGVDDVLPCFDADGRGAIVTASRTVIYAFQEQAGDWTQAVADAADRFADELGRAAGLR
ncbi:MAG: orotidine-5'-phosphate decarboxylase [Planctomycetota bacterium]|nr:orotidine-5'-phosphate decarboxylase [Planctomycetota bacterium]